MGGTTLGSIPLPVLPPCPPSHPFHHRGHIPRLGGRGGNTPPLQTHPTAPPPQNTPTPIGTGATGLGDAQSQPLDANTPLCSPKPTTDLAGGALEIRSYWLN